MVHVISPRHCQTDRQLSDWPSSTILLAAVSSQSTAEPVRPVPDQYTLVTDEQINEQTNKGKNIAYQSPPLSGGGLSFSTNHIKEGLDLGLSPKWPIMCRVGSYTLFLYSFTPQLCTREWHQLGSQSLQCWDTLYCAHCTSFHFVPLGQAVGVFV